MNHESVGLGERRTRKVGDRTVDSMKRCILIVLSVSMIILTSLGSARAVPFPVLMSWRSV